MSQDSSKAPEGDINNFKDALGDLRADLSSLKEEATSLDENKEESSALDSGEVMELKRRMARSEEEMKALTGAMKSTLLDVRSIMTDMDNPFNMLRNLGVDKLVNSAVEDVENEVLKQKREERKKKMAKADEDPDKVIAIQGSNSNPQFSPKQVPNINPPNLNQNPVQNHMDSSKHGTTSDSSQDLRDHNSHTTRDVYSMYQEPKSTNNRIMEQFEDTKNSIEQLTGEVCALTKIMGQFIESFTNESESSKQKHSSVPNKRESYHTLYYDTYVSLLAEYLIIKFGERNANQLLLEGLYKGWASPKVVKDVRDNLPAESQKWDIAEAAIGYKVPELKTEVEDKILFTSLLSSLDKPVNEWKEITQVFLLLSLVKSVQQTEAIMEE